LPEELFKLLIIIGLSLLVSLVFIAPVIIWRAIRRKPLFPKGKKIESAKIFYFGIILFGVFASILFYTGKPYFGSAILLVFLVFIIGLIAFKKTKGVEGGEAQRIKESR